MATCCFPGRRNKPPAHERRNGVATDERAGALVSDPPSIDDLCTAYPHSIHPRSGDGAVLRVAIAVNRKEHFDGHDSCTTILSRAGQGAGASQGGPHLLTWVDSLLSGTRRPRTELEHRSGRAGAGAAQVLCRLSDRTHHRGEGTHPHRSLSRRHIGAGTSIIKRCASRAAHLAR